MNASQEINLANRASISQVLRRVRLACERFEDQRLTLAQWSEALDFAVQEVRDIIHPPIRIPHIEPTARLELLKWAKDTQVIDWCNLHHIHPNRRTQWRWIDSDEVHGMIHALPTIRGIPRITDGVIVYVEREDGFIFKAHMHWFESDENDKDRDPNAPVKPRKKGIKAAAKVCKALCLPDLE